MANKSKGWQKFLACTCTHGSEADPRALDAILRLREAWKPDFVLHLGDAIDVRNMRAGARRDSTDPDYGASMTDDVLQGLSFLKELSPTSSSLATMRRDCPRCSTVPAASIVTRPSAF
jgi:hypothetical protein